MTQAVTELVVDGSGALSVLGQYEKGMERAGEATQQSTGALDRYNKAMDEFQAAQEKGLAITTQSVTRRTAEQRAMERWQAQLSQQHRLEIQLRREAERAAVDWSNAVALGYAKPAQAVSFLTALEQKHAAQLRDMAAAAQGAAAAQANLKSRVDATSASLRAQSGTGGGFHSTNLLFQMQDIGMMAAMGQAPHILALQQGTQVAGIFHQIGDGKKIVEALQGAFMGLLNPISLLTVGAIGLGTAIFQAAMQGREGAKTLDEAFEQHRATLERIDALYQGFSDRLTKYKENAELVAAATRTNAAMMEAVARNEFAKFQDQLIPMREYDQRSGQIRAFVDSTFAPFKDAILEIDRAIITGRPNFDAFIAQVNEIVATDPANLRKLGDQLIESGRAAYEAQAGADAARQAVDQLGITAATHADSVKALAEGLATLAGIAVPAMTNAERIQKEYADKISRITDPTHLAALDAEFLAAQTRAENQRLGSLVPTPTPRPNDIQRLDWEWEASQRRGRKSEAEKAQENYDKLIRRSEQFIAAQELERQALFMTEEAAAALRHEQNLLNAAANDNINLTPEQTDKLRELAVQMATAEAETKRMAEALDFAKDLAKGFIADFRSAFERARSDGLSVWDSMWSAMADATMKALDKIIDKLLNDVIDAIFQVNQAGSMFGGGGGGILGFIGGMFGGVSPTSSFWRPNTTAGAFFTSGFAGGGYTGSGSASDPAGIVHAGEFVFSKQATDRLGISYLDSLHRAAKGYMAGGLVTRAHVSANTNLRKFQSGGYVPAVPRPSAPSSGAANVTINVQNNTGAQVEVGEPRQGADGSLTLDLIINEIEGKMEKSMRGGRLGTAAQQTFGLQRRTR